MPISIERLQGHSILRVEGECTVSAATEFKDVLTGGLVCGGELRVDLTGVGEIDLAILQVLWSAGKTGGNFSVLPSPEVVSIAREVGFDGFPWLAT